ncbi:7939_t:CDS:2 [Acaulospora colombiana]|uniref:7939_t:CDS:1 n=1 Tax=Acaulospora colombiana TaxID=27376 RepID=A0ACA9LAQ8_9GLOM|nr:7939_t:CDS:2 [Acaulospora colombiana]
MKHDALLVITISCSINTSRALWEVFNNVAGYTALSTVIGEVYITFANESRQQKKSTMIGTDIKARSANVREGD